MQCAIQSGYTSMLGGEPLIGVVVYRPSFPVHNINTMQEHLWHTRQTRKCHFCHTLVPQSRNHTQIQYPSYRQYHCIGDKYHVPRNLRSGDRWRKDRPCHLVPETPPESDPADPRCTDTPYRCRPVGANDVPWVNARSLGFFLQEEKMGDRAREFLPVDTSPSFCNDVLRGNKKARG